MREMSKMGARSPGSIPGGGSLPSTSRDSGKGKCTEQCSVKVAKALPGVAGEESGLGLENRSNRVLGELARVVKATDGDDAGCCGRGGVELEENHGRAHGYLEGAAVAGEGEGLGFVGDGLYSGATGGLEGEGKGVAGDGEDAGIELRGHSAARELTEKLFFEGASGETEGKAGRGGKVGGPESFDGASSILGAGIVDGVASVVVGTATDEGEGEQSEDGFHPVIVRLNGGGGKSGTAGELADEIRSNLSKTFGKNGRRELPAVADEPPSVARAMLEALDRARVNVQAAGGTGADLRIKCARQGCTRDRSFGSVWCSGHGAAAAAAGDGGASMTCDNLPRFDPAGECAEDAEQPSDNPARMEAECNCCHANQPCECCEVHWPRVAGQGKQIPRELLSDAFELQWQALADESGLDPVTVAKCKQLRDVERAVLG